MGVAVVRSARAHRARGPGQGRPSKALGRRGPGRGLSRVAPMPRLREGNEPHSCPHHRLEPGQCPQTSADSRRCWGWKSLAPADVLPPSAEQFLCKASMPSQLRTRASSPGMWPCLCEHVMASPRSLAKWGPPRVEGLFLSERDGKKFKINTS